MKGLPKGWMDVATILTDEGVNEMADLLLCMANFEDSNTKLHVLGQLSKQLDKVHDKIESKRSALYSKLDKNTKYVRCPHCNNFIERATLIKEASDHKLVKGKRRLTVDLGEYDGFETAEYDTEFNWAKCPCCKKKIYTMIDRIWCLNLFDRDNLSTKPIYYCNNH